MTIIQVVLTIVVWMIVAAGMFAGLAVVNRRRPVDCAVGALGAVAALGGAVLLLFQTDPWIREPMWAEIHRLLM
jgi:membrane associated rhomboid family serine protease